MHGAVLDSRNFRESRNEVLLGYDAALQQPLAEMYEFAVLVLNGFVEVVCGDLVPLAEDFTHPLFLPGARLSQSNAKGLQAEGGELRSFYNTGSCGIEPLHDNSQHRCEGVTTCLHSPYAVLVVGTAEGGSILRVADQSGLAGDTKPCSVLILPGVRKSPMPHDRLAFHAPFFAVTASHNRAIAINMHGDIVVGYLIGIRRAALHGREELRLVHERTVEIGVHECISEELIQCADVFMLFGQIPGVFHGEDFGFVRAGFHSILSRPQWPSSEQDQTSEEKGFHEALPRTSFLEMRRWYSAYRMFRNAVQES